MSRISSNRNVAKTAKGLFAGLSLFCCLAALALGCGGTDKVDANDNALTPDGVEVPFDKLKDADILVRVDGKPITKAEFLVASSLEDKIRRMQAGDPVIGPNKPAEEAKIASRPHTLSDMVRRAQIRDYAARKGLKVAPEEREAYVKSLLLNLKRGFSTLDKVANEFMPEERRLFLQYVEDDAAAQPLRNLVAGVKEFSVSEDEVIHASNRWLKAQSAMTASNMVEAVKMQKALDEIRAGADFADVASAYSEYPEEGVKWGDFVLEELGMSPDLKAWLSKSKTGDVSPRLKAVDGWVVVKVLARRYEDLPPGSKDEPRELWELARILRPRYETAEGRTHDEIVEIILQYKNDKTQKKIGDEIVKASKVEWPHGSIEKLFGGGGGQ